MVFYTENEVVADFGKGMAKVEVVTMETEMVEISFNVAEELINFVRSKNSS